MKAKLSKKVGARKALVKNLASSLILYEAITTTTAKARALVPHVERYLTRARAQTLQSYRALRAVLSPQAAKKLHEHLGGRIDKPSGRVRVTLMGNRGGDGAPLARVELLLAPLKRARQVSDLPKAGKKAPSEKAPSKQKGSHNAKPDNAKK